MTIWALVRKVFSLLGLLIAVLIGIGIGIALMWGFRPAESEQQGQPAVTSAGQMEQSATMWTCSMHPDVRRFKPGRCPWCRMELIPVRVTPQEMMTSLREFATTEAAKALMDIETTTVERKFVTAEIRMVGKVDYDETRLAYITAWIPGRLDRLFVDYTGVPVRKGDHMVYMYSPELLAAQEELIQAHKAVENLRASDSEMIRSMSQATVKAAREKLRLWGLTPEQITEIEERGTPSDHMTIYAPIGGTVIHKNGQEQMYVNTGTRIYTVANLSQVWVKLDAYESDLMWLHYGQKVEFASVSYPGETFNGTISFIDPVLNPNTRTVKVRVNAPNADGKLKPEMFVKAVVRAKVAAGGMVVGPKLAGKWICPMHPSIIKSDAGECDICQMALVRIESSRYVSVDPTKAERPLVIPVSAALVTGTRAIVYVEVPDKDKPRYEGREIVLGPRAGDYYIVRSGLRAGERVVTKGNFKIDSALQIEAKPSMMTPEGGGGSGGHQHGGPQKPATGAGPKAMIQIPAPSREQLRAVLSTAEKVNQAFERKDLGQIRTAFAGLEKSVKAVDMTALEGHPHMLWMEMSMRLGNDAVEGHNAKTLAEARRVFESLKTNASSLRAKFGLDHGGHEHE